MKNDALELQTGYKKKSKLESTSPLNIRDKQFPPAKKINTEVNQSSDDE